MKSSAATLLAAEMRAFVAQEHADVEWIEWVRLAVARGVRLDVSTGSLREVARFVEVAPGMVIRTDRGAEFGGRSAGQPGASGEE